MKLIKEWIKERMWILVIGTITLPIVVWYSDIEIDAFVISTYSPIVILTAISIYLNKKHHETT